MLTLKLLGPVKVSYNQQADFKIRSSNALALLIYLVVEGMVGQDSHRRESLMALLWPDSLPHSAQTNLRQALYKLRQAIPTAMSQVGESVPLVIADRERVSLNPEATVELDAAAFLELTRSTDPGQLRQAVQLYRSDFLSDFSLPTSNPYELWAEGWRERLRREMQEALVSLGARAFEAADYPTAERYARRQLETDNLRDDAHRLLMKVLAHSQRVPEAVEHYDAYCRLLKNELDLDPSPEMTALAEAIQHGELRQASSTAVGSSQVEIPPPTDHPVDALPAPTPHNLPVQTVPFIGRWAELEDLDELLSGSDARLVTITGPGGIGKTRLSLAAAEHQLASNTFSEGIFFVPLAGLGQPERICPVIADVLNFRLEQDEPQLLAFLRKKSILLVLDNFEHLMVGSRLVSRILQAAPQVKVLATSRERLHLQGEHVYPLQGFPVDEESTLVDARQMFLQTARRIRPDFEENTSNREALKEIFRLVEGMPLALELAASWVDLISPAEIAAEIWRGLDILKTDMQDIPDRHKSMQAVFDTSWQNLPPTVQDILAACSVFQGGFTREAAETITQASLGDLAVLVNKSLLSFDTDKGRYAIHELLRQYSAARLDDSVVAERHKDYYCDWLIRHGKPLTDSDEEIGLRRIEGEMDNIRAALHWALETQNLDHLDQAICCLGHFFTLSDSHQEGTEAFHQFWMKLSVVEPPPTRTLYWTAVRLVFLLGRVGRKSEVQEFWPRCRILLAELIEAGGDNRMEQAMYDFEHGFVLYINQPLAAQELFQRSYELYIELDALWEAGMALMGKARAIRNQGDLAAAEGTVHQALEIFQSLGNNASVASAQLLIGNLAGIAGRYNEAERWLVDGIALKREHRDTWSMANVGLDKLRMVYFFNGRFDDALAPLSEYGQLSEDNGYVWGVISHRIALGQLYLHLGRYPEALKQGREGCELASEHQQDAFLCEALVLSAQAHIALEDYDVAREKLLSCQARCPSRAVGTSLYIAGNDFYWAVLETHTGRLSVAEANLRVELEKALERKAELNLANAVCGTALLKAKNGQAVPALELYALASQHPFVSNSRWFADVVGREIEQAAQSLSPGEAASAQEAGADFDLWGTVESLLKEGYA
jgi:predicted ATPase/DNA-binding SARP family transcriptional activator